MARLHVIEDGEIGRGRQNDSSSSRESSPRRTQKRSFSPTSDDGDLVVPPIADDDTPPPPERPLLRHPVGFVWNNSSSLSTAPDLNTYQASIPITASSSSPIFLPGQEVPLVLPAPKSKGSRTKRSDGASTKKRRTAEYSGQTGRFRLNAYDPTPSASPPLHHGQGPYSSMYRAPSEVADRGFSAASPTPTLSSSGGGGYAGSIYSTTSAPNLSTKSRVSSQSTAKRTKQSETRAKPPTGRAKASDAKTKPSGKGKTSVSTRKTPASVSSNNIPSANRDVTTSGHYRHDYDGSMPKALDSHHSPGSPGHSRSPLPEPRVSNSTATSPTVGGSATDAVDMGAKRVFRQLRMVTLLIQDLRSGIADHQLAEVKIPLKPADDVEDGFWADAKELSEKLQASPARIDGPAKAYTLRGKYRQFFLRVTADNEDEYISANLVVKPDRTLDIVVETLPVPGTLPLPPQIPRDLRSPTPESFPSSPVLTQGDVFCGPGYELASENRPPWSSSTWSPDRDSSPRSTSRTNHSSYESTTSWGTRVSGTSAAITKSGHVRQNRGYESPASDGEPDELHEAISKAIDTIMQKDSGWADFFKAKVSQRVSDVLKQYQFVQRMMDEWVGKRAPFRTCHHLVEASHITHALHIDDPRYSSACTETLALLALYGPQGQRLEDSRIVAMINDTRDPEYNAKPIKRMLHLLREIDESWKKDHPGSPESASSHDVGGT